MSGLFKRPLMLFCLIFFLGSCLSAALPSSLRLLFCVIFPIIFLLAFFLFGKNRSILRRSVLLSALALFLSVILSYIHLDLRTAPVYSLDGKTISFTGTITETVSTTSYSGYYTVSSKAAGSDALSFTFMLECDDPTLVPGDRITGTALFSRFPETENGFPLRRYYLAKDILMEAESVEAITVLGTDSSLFIRIKSLNRYLCGVISSLLPREEAGLVNALLLGNKDTLPDEASRNFRRLGISHMLAISGMHLSILTAVFDKLLSLILRKRRVRRLLLLIPILFFMFLTGLSPSVLRAGLMLILYECMFLLSGREDSPSALLYAGTIILLFQPFAAMDVGLQLSVAAMAACLLFGRITGKSKVTHGRLPVRLLRNAGTVFLLSLYVLCFILPLSYLYFGELSLFSPVMNVLFAPLVSVLLFLSPLLLLCSGSYFLAGLLVIPVRLVASATLDLAAFCVTGPIPVLSLRYAGAPLVVCILFVLTLAFPFAGKKGRIIYATAALAASCLLGAYVVSVRSEEAEKVRVHINHHLKSDTLLLFSENKALLCDFSDGSYSAMRGSLGILDESYLIDLDVLLLTHYHQRHVDTVRTLCAKRFVGEIWLPEPKEEAEIGICAAIKETAASLGTDVRLYAPQTEALSFGDALITVSERGRIKRSTHPTLFFSMEAFQKDFVYIGASVMESDLAPSAALLVQGSEVSVLGVHGPICKKSFAFMAPHLTHLFFTGETVSFLERETSTFPALSYEKTITDGQAIIFTQNEILIP